MDAQLLGPNDLIRPWRRATIVASFIAAIELVLLIGAAAVLLAKPLSHMISHHAAVVAAKPAKRAKAHTPAVTRKPVAAPVAKARPRDKVKIMVFNGNGLTGAAASAASRLEHLGYRVSGTGNARRQDYATTVVMYKPGYRAEGLRLAHDLKAQVVGPLDGLQMSALDGGQLAVILGA